ncbi:ATP-binding protein [Edaphobacter modestus]|uniref:ATP-binding protein n=1 Tax=Edaphobacter modestus TaxID=388466 RepID=UPI001A91DF80|nr:ATP-binding protein [Edaphobacter modestus]
MRKLLQQFPAVALLGPRQVGKTTLAHSLADELGQQALYLDLELPSDRAKLTDAELYLSQHAERLVILDEIHRLPGIFETLRSLIDQRRRKGKRNCHFLLLGSASIDLLQQSAETLAGRIAYEELTPFSVSEVAEAGIGSADQLWVRGGFPDSFLAANDQDSFTWRSAFIQTYLERDVPALGPRIPAETLRRYWQMLAHNQGQMLNAAQIASGLGVSGHTVARYLDIMVDLLLVRRLQPWATNAKKRLVRTPKVYVRDTGLLHALLGIRDQEELLGHPVVGASWEGMLIENILHTLPATARPTFYRTSVGAEIDLVIEFSAKERWAIEVKRSLGNPAPSKGFYIGCEDIRATRQIVLYPGEERFRLDSTTEVMSLPWLLREIGT